MRSIRALRLRGLESAAETRIYNCAELLFFHTPLLRDTPVYFSLSILAELGPDVNSFKWNGGAAGGPWSARGVPGPAWASQALPLALRRLPDKDDLMDRESLVDCQGAQSQKEGQEDQGP